jgi:transcriptional regulator with XRE-family HTH domain
MSLQVSPKSIKVAKNALIGTSLTQQQLADALGVTRQPINKFFNGKPIERTLFLRICEKLKLEWSVIALHIDELEAEPNVISSESSVRTRVFISYRAQEPDRSLAQHFYEAIKAAGHEAFMAGESIHLGENWVQRIGRELEGSDYFLLLLSPQSATSEMVTEEVRRAKELKDSRPDSKPVILPIRVSFPFTSELNYDLRGYLDQIQQKEWKSEADTPKILQEILTVIGGGEEWKMLLGEESTFTPRSPIPNSPPFPVAEPELPEGQVDLASAFYVERPPIEERCYEAIVKPGSLIRIKAPRQMGKTSLMARILYHAAQQGCLTVPLSFQLADGKVFNDLDKFLRWFCASVGRRLKLPSKLDEYWDDIFGSKDNCTVYFEEYLLEKIKQPLVLGLDEVDLVFQHREIAADFFGLLRAWHEEAKTRDIWKKLRLVVVHSTEVYIPMNINQSPFNVGLSIELPELKQEQVLDLAKKHGLNWSVTEAKQLMAMVGGHPFLVRVALYAIARQDTTLNILLQNAATESGFYGDHLRRHLWNLEQRPELAKAFKKVVATDTPTRLDSIQCFQLLSMGLVHQQGNDVTPRCDLYRRYFQERLL